MPRPLRLSIFRNSKITLLRPNCRLTLSTSPLVLTTCRTGLCVPCSKRRAAFLSHFNRHRRGPPPFKKRTFSVFHHLGPHKRSNRQTETLLVSCPQEQKAHLPKSVRTSVLGGEF
ncbi:hypothetical protein NPIL_369511 [Nephila pilipes]|uniref:Uncharacterized protein n=1 Tax=Nephila pilipes TaxID=299642 RepID=A0A8X6R2Y6_NEPPI|nr:hypothetical protein NPIL_369511 [Nephila pilipes]